MSLLITFLVGWLAVNGLLYLAQPGMLFYPMARIEETPRNWGLAFEDVTFETEDDLSLHGWFIPRPGASRVLLFFHGNAGNISHRRESVALFHHLGLDVFIIDYRGYGRSEGRPSEVGLYRDARAAWGWLTRERGYQASQIVLFGRSLGAALAADLAAETVPAGIILESGFSSAAEAARELFPGLSRLVVLRYRFDAAGAIAQARAPVLVLHSPDDEVVPYALGRRLFEAAPEPKGFVAMRGGHNDGFLRSEPEYGRALADFFASLPSPGGRP